MEQDIKLINHKHLLHNGEAMKDLPVAPIALMASSFMWTEVGAASTAKRRSMRDGR